MACYYCSNQCSGTCSGSCTSCTGACSGSCTSCTGYCTGTCIGSCEVTCGMACADDCTIGCTGSCSNVCTSCRDICTGSCVDSCSGGCSSCSGTCTLVCADSCSNGCFEGCLYSCINGCYEGCKDGCKEGCLESCVETCSGSCSDACSTVCSANCDSECVQTCSGGCSTVCSVNCDSECVQTCSGGCSTVCSVNCDIECIQTCSGGCKEGCLESCVGTCIDNCVANCAVDCSDTCSGSSTTTNPGGSTLELGDTGSEVTALQQDLVNIGYSLSVTGTFNAATESAVRVFQTLTGIVVNGIVGSETSNRLATVVSNKNNGWLSRGMKGSDVLQLQNNLNTLGYSCGTADGEFGTNTYNAVRSFQAAKGLTQDGIVGPTTMSAINTALNEEPDESAGIITIFAKTSNSITLNIIRGIGKRIKFFEAADPEDTIDEVPITEQEASLGRKEISPLRSDTVYVFWLMNNTDSEPESRTGATTLPQGTSNPTITTTSVTNTNIAWNIDNAINKQFRVINASTGAVVASTTITSNDFDYTPVVPLQPNTQYKGQIISNGVVEKELVVTTTGGPTIGPAPNPIPTNTGKITVNGTQYNIYVPGYDDNDSNASFTGGGWTTIQTIPFSSTERDWAGIIADISMEKIEQGFQEYAGVALTQQFAVMSFTAGLIDAYKKNTVTTYFQVAIQKNGSEYRAVVQFGTSNTVLQNRAGSSYYYSDLKSYTDANGVTWGKSEAQELVKDAFPWTDDDKTYDKKITLDSEHSSDPYMGYLSVNADGKLVFTPKLRAGDNEVIGHYTGFLSLGWEEDASMRNFMEMSLVLPDKFNTAVNGMIGTSVTFTGTP